MRVQGYDTLLGVAMEKHCPGHKVAVQSNLDGVLLVHGDHRRQLNAVSVESENALIRALEDFISTVHAYDEDEDER